MRNLAYPQEHLKPRAVTRLQLQNYLRDHLADIQREKDANVVGPVTRQFRRMAARVVEPTTIRGEER